MDLIERAIAAYRAEEERAERARVEWRARHLVDIKQTAARYFGLEEGDLFRGDEQLVRGAADEYAVRTGDMEFSLPDGELIVHYRCALDDLVRDYFVAHHAQVRSNFEQLGRMFINHACPCRRAKEEAA